jgi:serine/threonine protein kinase
VNIIMKCLQKNPEQRFSDVEELAESLAAFVGRPWRRQRPKPAPTNRSQEALQALATAPTELPSERTVPASPLAASNLIAPSNPQVEAVTASAVRPRKSLWLRVAGAGLVVFAGLGLAFLLRGATPEQSANAEVAETVELPTPIPSAQAAASASAPAPAAAEPDLSSAIRDAFASRKTELEGCYAAGLRVNPRMTSNVKFKLNVLPDGTPRNFEIVGEGLDEAVKRCRRHRPRVVDPPPSVSRR